jgi:hypothetical protein
MMIRECAKGDVKFFGRKCIILRNGDLKEVANALAKALND